MKQRDLRPGAVAIDIRNKDVLHTIIAVSLVEHSKSTLYRVVLLSHNGIVIVRSDRLMEQVVIP